MIRRILAALLLCAGTASAQTTVYVYNTSGARSAMTLSDTLTQTVAQIIGSPVNGDCVEFDGTTGSLTDTGATCASGTGTVTTVGTINGASKSANGAVISGNYIYMQTEDATYPGLLSVGAQPITGVKTFTSGPVVNLNTASAPTALTGTVVQAVQADGTAARYEVDAFGATAHYSTATYGGTNASPTAVTSGTEIASFSAGAYNGSGVPPIIGNLSIYTAENQSSGHQGSYWCVKTTPIASTTAATSLCQQNDGGVTIGSPTGASKGAGTLNAASGIYVNGGAVPTLGGSNTWTGTNTYDALSTFVAPVYLNPVTLTGPMAGNGTDALHLNSVTINDPTTPGPTAKETLFDINQATLTATSTLTTTSAANTFLGGPMIAGNNQTITTDYGVQIGGGSVVTGTGAVSAAYALTVGTPSGATSDFSAQFGIPSCFGGGCATGQALVIAATESAAPSTGRSLQVTNGTFTDNSTAAGGTATSYGGIQSAQPTLASSNATSGSPVTTTTAYNTLISGLPISSNYDNITTSIGLDIAAGSSVAGTNGSVTTAEGLLVAVPTGATNNYGANIGIPSCIGGGCAVGRALILSATESGTPTSSGNSLTVNPGTFTDNNTAAGGTATAYLSDYLNQPTLTSSNATSGSNVTTTSAVNAGINGPVIASNYDNITTDWGLRIYAGSAVNGTNGTVATAYGLEVDQPTGATSNYAAKLLPPSCIGACNVNSEFAIANAYTQPSAPTSAQGAEFNDATQTITMASAATGTYAVYPAQSIGTMTVAYPGSNAVTLTDLDSLYIAGAPATSYTGTGGSLTATNSYGLEVAGGGAKITGGITLPNLSASTAADVLCYASSTGVVTYETTGTSCTVSLEELKDIKGPIDPKEALDFVMKSDPFWYVPNDKNPAYADDRREQPGFGAHHIESIDPRLAAYAPNGDLQSVRYLQMSPVLAAAMQAQQQQIKLMKQEIEELKAQIAGWPAASGVIYLPSQSLGMPPGASNAYLPAANEQCYMTYPMACAGQ